jgi:hypothetical protein
MEYSWQFLFAGVAELCPAMNVCYCDGYGVCFGGAQEMEDWSTLRTSIGNMTSQADALASEPDMEEKVREMRDKADETEQQVQKLKLNAFETR